MLGWLSPVMNGTDIPLYICNWYVFDFSIMIFDETHMETLDSPATPLYAICHQ